MNVRAAVFVCCVVLVVVAIAAYYLSPSINQGGSSVDALIVSKVSIIGLAVIVALMAGLTIVFWAIGVSDRTQALGMPEGSIRALIAFGLVLAFICMASFLYSGMRTAGEAPKGGQMTLITQAELDNLKSQFTVAYETARKNGQDPILDTDNKTPLYNATYYLKSSQAADDLAKQIFTTLATVFVSVVSFYFGSSTTTSAVRAGAKAVGGGGPAGGTAGSGPRGTDDGQAGPGGAPPGAQQAAADPEPQSAAQGDLAVASLSAPVPQQS